MTDETAAPENYSGEDTGLREAAANLTRDREATAAVAEREAAARPQARERTPEEDEARAYIRKRAQDAHEDQLEKEGRKLNPRNAAEVLARLREYEARVAEQEGVTAPPVPEAQQQEQGREPAAAEIEQHPKVREAVAQAENLRNQASNIAVQAFAFLRSEALADFSDINTDTDVARLAAEDPARFEKFKASAQKLHAVSQYIEGDIARHKHQERHQFQTFAADQDARFIEKHPELNDRAAFRAAHESTVDALRSLGFTDQELVQGFTTNPILRDHRTQEMFYQLSRYHQAMRAAKAPQPRPIPQVQRPGTASAHDGADRTEYQRLRERHGSEMTMKEAAAELVAKRSARARR